MQPVDERERRDVFMQGRRQYGLPQICDGPIDPGLSPPRFILRLRLCVSVFEAGDLSLQLGIELVQHLLFTNGVLAVENHLFLIAI